MNLSSSGRIVIIDDKLEEVMPLIESLSQMGAPYFYFSGNEDQLPKSPMKGIRIVFLDIELDGFAGINDKSKASAVANVLSKVISKQNGPFTVVFWTKHREITQDVIHYCKIAGIMPITNLELDKLECMKNMYKGLPDVIDEKLKEIGALLLLIQWDNLVHKSSTEFFFDFSSLVPADEDWSKNISGIF